MLWFCSNINQVFLGTILRFALELQTCNIKKKLLAGFANNKYLMEEKNEVNLGLEFAGAGIRLFHYLIELQRS